MYEIMLRILNPTYKLVLAYFEIYSIILSLYKQIIIVAFISKTF